RATTAAKALPWERKHPTDRAFVEYPAYGSTTKDYDVDATQSHIQANAPDRTIDLRAASTPPRRVPVWWL
ncbi:MAG: hypothetical protein ACLFNI_10720, partial [Natronomonas sp.]